MSNTTEENKIREAEIQAHRKIGTCILSVKVSNKSKARYMEMQNSYNQATFKPKGMFLDELIDRAFKESHV